MAVVAVERVVEVVAERAGVGANRRIDPKTWAGMTAESSTHCRSRREVGGGHRRCCCCCCYCCCESSCWGVRLAVGVSPSWRTSTPILGLRSPPGPAVVSGLPVDLTTETSFKMCISNAFWQLCKKVFPKSIFYPAFEQNSVSNMDIRQCHKGNDSETSTQADPENASNV